MWSTCALQTDSMKLLRWSTWEKQLLCPSMSRPSSYPFLRNRAANRSFSYCNLKPRVNGDRVLKDSRQTLEVLFGSRYFGVLRVQAGEDNVRVSGEDSQMQILDEWVDSKQLYWEAEEEGVGVVDVQIEKTGMNSRKVSAKIVVEAPLEDVWTILTDYAHLSDFLPGLTVNKLLEKRENGARLYQVAEKELAFGLKFTAKAVVDCEEKLAEVHQDLIQRDIDFETVEGDFQVFRGTWRMEQVSNYSPSSSHTVEGNKNIKTILSYILIVQPKNWLPVALVEGMVANEVKMNLVCIRNRSLQPRVSG